MWKLPLPHAPHSSQLRVLTGWGLKKNAAFTPKTRATSRHHLLQSLFHRTSTCISGYQPCWNNIRSPGQGTRGKARLSEPPALSRPATLTLSMRARQTVPQSVQSFDAAHPVPQRVWRTPVSKPVHSITDKDEPTLQIRRRHEAPTECCTVCRVCWGLRMRDTTGVDQAGQAAQCSSGMLP